VICTPCGQEIESGTSYIAGLKIHHADCDLMAFVWGCVHRPVENADVYFGSEVCAQKWAAEHPIHKLQLTRLLLAARQC